ncbi:hypothetical protein [Streptosporangium sp. NPDC020145]|uniref:hypothetical protein n=1 Tax=Streptosporangium sp. NPDC020145 TaxID=3154694 RepID=UPI00341BE510
MSGPGADEPLPSGRSQAIGSISIPSGRRRGRESASPGPPMGRAPRRPVAVRVTHSPSGVRIRSSAASPTGQAPAVGASTSTSTDVRALTSPRRHSRHTCTAPDDPKPSEDPDAAPDSGSDPRPGSGSDADPDLDPGVSPDAAPGSGPDLDPGVSPGAGQPTNRISVPGVATTVSRASLPGPLSHTRNPAVPSARTTSGGTASPAPAAWTTGPPPRTNVPAPTADMIRAPRHHPVTASLRSPDSDTRQQTFSGVMSQ